MAKKATERKDGTIMALSKAQVREILSSAGIAEEHVTETVNKIMEGHLASIEALREERDNLKKDLEAAKADNKAGELEKVKKEFEDYKAQVAEEKTKAAKEKAYRDALKEANLNDRGIEKAVKFAEWDKIEIDEDGKLKSAKDHIKTVREEWSEYINKTGTQGANTPTPPANNGKGGKLTREEIYKTDDKGRFVMDAAARQKALADLLANE